MQRSGSQCAAILSKRLRRSAAVATAAFAAGVFAQSAHAQVYWTGAAAPDTNWAIDNNWDNFGATGRPSFADTAVLNNGGTVTISDAEVAGAFLIGMNADTSLSPANLGLGGTVNYVDGGALATGASIPSIDVGVDPGSTNVWNHNGGTVTTGELFRVGVNAGATGTLNMHGGTIDVSTGDTSGLDFFLVGDQGNGTLNMDGGTIKSRGLWAVGLQPHSTSSATITGGTIQGGDFFIAGNSDVPNKFGAHATFTMSGGTGTFGGNMHVADSAYATATVNQSGNAAITGQREVLIGVWSDVTYNLSDSATLDAYGQLNVATFTPGERPEGAIDAPTTTFNQSGQSSVTAAGALIGEFGHAIYNMSGGTFHVLGQTRGTATLPGPEYVNMLIGRDGGGINQGLGEFNQSGGSVQVDTQLFLGDFDDSKGIYTISGGSLTVNGNVHIGAALASNAPPDATRKEPSQADGAQGQALRATGIFRVRGGAATINIGGQLLANPGDKGAFRAGPGNDNHATLAFDIGSSGDLSRINVAHEADLDGAVIDMGFLASSTFVPAYQQQFELVNASLFGATGTGTTQNTGTGSGVTLPVEDASDWAISVIAADGGRQTLVATNLVVQGDTDSNKKVDFTDLLALAKHYGLPTGQTRASGDFNRTGSVTFDDLLILAKHYGFGTTGAVQGTLDPSSPIAADWALAQALAPEPTSLALIGGASMLLARRRRRNADVRG